MNYSDCPSPSGSVVGGNEIIAFLAVLMIPPSSGCGCLGGGADPAPCLTGGFVCPAQQTEDKERRRQEQLELWLLIQRHVNTRNGARVRTRSHTHICVDTLACAHTHNQTRAQAHTRAHAGTNAHTPHTMRRKIKARKMTETERSRTTRRKTT